MARQTGRGVYDLQVKRKAGRYQKISTTISTELAEEIRDAVSFLNKHVDGVETSLRALIEDAIYKEIRALRKRYNSEKKFEARQRDKLRGGRPISAPTELVPETPAKE
jgi:hypothetical protein